MSVVRRRQYLAILMLTPLIVGGSPADETYSYMASLQPPGYRHYCGATLVSPIWMVTAAHCVEGKNPATMRIRIGSSDRTAGGELAQPLFFVSHPYYTGGDYDIALIRLAVASMMRPAPIAAHTLLPSTQVRLLGWGQTCPRLGCARGGPVELRQLDTTVIDDSECQDMNGANELCLAGTTAATACYGDSGGPALVREGGHWAIAGLTSRGGDDSTTCGTGNAIYTDVTAFEPWIELVTAVQ